MKKYSKKEIKDFIENNFFSKEEKIDKDDLKIYVEEVEEDLRKGYEEQAQNSVKSRLVLEAIVDDAKIEITDEELSEKIKEMATNYGKKEEELMQNENLKDYLEKNMKIEKAIKFIVDNAKIK